MGHLISFWTLAKLIRTQLDQWFGRAGDKLPRATALRFLKMLRALEETIREGLNADAAALNIAPFTPAARTKYDAANPASCQPRFCVTPPSSSSPGANHNTSAHSILAPNVPIAPLQDRFTRACSVLASPAPYARRLALRLARKCAKHDPPAPCMPGPHAPTPQPAKSPASIKSGQASKPQLAPKPP